MKQAPKVGVAVIISKNGKFLLGKRRGSHGEGSWCFPGGHLEFNESWEDCAKRETLEETNLSIKDIRFAAATNDIFQKEQKHYITIFMFAGQISGELKLMEPDKCEKWEWFDWDKLPQPLFIPIQNLIKSNFQPGFPG